MDATILAPLTVVNLVALLFLGAVAYRLWSRVRAIESRYQTLVAGTEGGSLEEILYQHMDNVRQAVASATEAEALAYQLADQCRSHLQYCGVVRFNPFANTGGDQSFCIALADGEGHGVVITSLHAREGTRIYAKPLVNWGSPYPLTDEERAAIDRAVNRERDLVVA